MAKINQVFDVDGLNWKYPVLLSLTVTFVLLGLGAVDWLPLLSKKAGAWRDVSLVLPSRDRLIVMALSCLAGSAASMILSRTMLWVGIAALTIAVLAVSFAMYSTVNYGVWWTLPGIGLLLCGIMTNVIQEFGRVRDKVQLRTNLLPLLPSDQLDTILKHPHYLNDKERQISASVLVIQVVGMESIRNRYAINDVFFELRRLNGLIQQIAKKFNGVKLPSYREGFLVCFGDRLRKNALSKWHPELSLQCAAEIQTQNALAVMQAAKQQRPAFALRIGVCSARILLGDIGDAEIFDFVILGDALDEARKLEQACDVNSILFSKMTRDLLVKIDPGSSFFHKKLINLDKTGGSDVREVFEFDPFQSNPELRRECMSALRQSTKYERKEERHAAMNAKRLVIQTSYGVAQLVNFSINGMAILLKAPLTNGTTVRMQISAPDSAALVQRLQNRELTALLGDVKWSRSSGKFTLHGLGYKNLEAPDREFLQQCLLEYEEGLVADDKVA